MFHLCGAKPRDLVKMSAANQRLTWSLVAIAAASAAVCASAKSRVPVSLSRHVHGFGHSDDHEDRAGRVRLEVMGGAGEKMGLRNGLLAVGFLIALAGCGLSASGSEANTTPQRAREPDNVATQATGPVGSGGIVLHDGSGRDPDWFYFKIAPRKVVTIEVKNLNGLCGVDPDQDFVKTATAPEGELHYFESVGGEAGSTETYSASPFHHVKLIVGLLSPNIGDNAAANKGCSELVRATPASALILTRSPGDKRTLRAPILADQ
jgi:hypothetical protein